MRMILKVKFILAIVLIGIGVFVICGGLMSYVLRDKSSMMVVLAYHRVASSEIKQKYYKDDQWVNDLSKFEQQMEYLYKNNYTTLFNGRVLRVVFGQKGIRHRKDMFNNDR